MGSTLLQSKNYSKVTGETRKFYICFYGPAVIDLSERLRKSVLIFCKQLHDRQTTTQHLVKALIEITTKC